ncbi:Glutaredoxin-like protein C5orf63-like protein [Trichoplax sp. H2]|nr:Glutaredoxin-like protein C5orf63-like protein [Trichoplax sp. H2]|eukprot:RDD36561.1 Glutaredoxin-like protein C5orf63-like protein [Trichoplax sp. H2]
MALSRSILSLARRVTVNRLVFSIHPIQKFSSLPKITLFTKKDCPLCEEAKEVILQYRNKIDYEEVDILCPGNKEWFDLYQFEIPVLHINGKFVANGHVDEYIMNKELGLIQNE